VRVDASAGPAAAVLHKTADLRTDIGETARHEAYHLAAALVLGFRPLEASASLDEDGLVGRVSVDLADEDWTTRRLKDWAVVVLTGPLSEGAVPSWPPSADSYHRDDRQLADVVSKLALTKSGWDELLDEAKQLTATHDFKQLAGLAEAVLAIGGTITEREAKDMHTHTRSSGLKYIDVEPSRFDAETVGEGEMVALASTFHNIDKHGDRVMPGAFTDTVASIKAGRTIPLVWGHDVHGSPQNIIGEIYDADQTPVGLEIKARFDLDDPVALKAWKLVKARRIDKLSIGYRIPSGGERRANGANELHVVHVGEVSLVLTPANDRARVLSFKAATPPTAPTAAALRLRSAEIEAELLASGVAIPTDARDLRRKSDAVYEEILARPRRDLRRKGDDLALEIAYGGDLPTDTAEGGVARLRRETRDLMAAMTTNTGGDETHA
jgi:HK97 family phage prohead protease